LKAIAGVRIESTKILVEGGNIGAADSLRLGKIDQVDPLPSANIIYSLTEKSNLRISATQTIARPNMRELAPFYSFEFISDAIFYGNPTLKRTLIQNYDLRYELFPNAGEVFAISAFYKRFKDPIIRENVVIASNPEFRLDNVDQAQVYGLELELRKDLSFISEKLQNFKFGSNLSLIKSTVDIPEGELNLIRFFNPEFSGSTRQFIGQSPIILNLNLSYVDSEKGFDAVLGYNFFGSRLDIVGTANTVDAFERGRGQLDFVLSKAFKRFQMRFNALNLLNPKYEVFSEFKGNDYVLSSYKTGLTLGLTLSYVIK
jgi:outer membrane receptor protein involved in Fe transport